MYLGVFPTLGWCSRRVWPIVWWAADRARILGGAGHFGCACSRPDKIAGNTPHPVYATAHPAGLLHRTRTTVIDGPPAFGGLRQ